MAKHAVIAAYILLICAVSVVLVLSRLLPARDQRLRSRISLLCAVTLLRLAVKFIYFYVEFYISSWHLNVIINLAMDTTYALSVALVLSLLAVLTGADFRSRVPVMAAACACYVLIFFLVGIFAIDPATNHDFVIEGAPARWIYFFNELFFLLAPSFYAIKYLLYAQKSRREVLAPVAALSAACVLYVLWVFLWDASFVIPLFLAVRRTKPVDGVLFFTLALVALYFCGWAGELRALVTASPARSERAAGGDGPLVEVPPARPERAAGSDGSLVEGFSARHGLTARESQVLLLVFQGQSNTSVAQALHISENTVKRHLSNIFGKAGVKNRFELIHAVSIQIS